MTYYDPYADMPSDGRWMKAQFHLHHLLPPQAGSMKREESAEPIEPIFKEYKAADYAIVAASSYHSWYDTAEIAERVGLRSYNGQEYVRYDGILLIGTSSFLAGTPQEAIDACNAQGGFAVICHPNQNPALPSPPVPAPLTREMSRPLTGAVGVEVYNGCLPRRHWQGIGFGAGLATDYWDEALTSGRKLWGFGTDDCHDGFEINVGWTEIFAPSDDFSVVKQAIQHGQIVASRGMRLYDWSFDGATLSVEADMPYYRAYEADYRFVGAGGTVLASHTGRFAQYTLSGDEPYVRVEARHADGSILWTQPLLRKEYFGL